MDDSDFRVVEAMRAYGGHFVRALAECAARADPDNLQLIKTTWPGYWKRYEQVADEVARTVASPGQRP